MEEIVAYICIGAVAFLIAVFITRAVFAIPRIVRTLRANAYLLALIADKQGCDQNKITKALQHIEGDVIAGELPSYKTDTNDKASVSTSDISRELDKLKQRFSLGEITKEQYESKRERLLSK